MKAVVFEEYNTFPTLKEVPEPTPGSGEVLLKVAGGRLLPFRRLGLSGLHSRNRQPH